MSRIIATKILVKIIYGKKSLSELQAEIQKIPPEDRPLVQEISYGVCRWYFRLSFIVNQLLKKPLKNKDSDINILILIGIYQLLFLRIPDHAVLSETVNTARLLKKEWATKLVNGILRHFQRHQKTLLAEADKYLEPRYAHPEWMIAAIKKTWDNWQNILNANNDYPALCLRVNLAKISRDDYLKLLLDDHIPAEKISQTNSGIRLLEKIPVSKIPGFEKGFVAVQDGSAQLAAQLLAPSNGTRVLDACAAPGGKTCHLLEIAPTIDLVAIDNDPNRIQKIQDNITRLQLPAAQIICHNAIDLSWWDQRPFDQILLDAPCSALGVINRHPDIKILRQLEHVVKLVQTQYELLKTLWQTLKPNGTLLYVTCSILPEENEQIIEKFLQKQPGCTIHEISADWGIKLAYGRQILPSMYPGMDGFYFCRLLKSA